MVLSETALSHKHLLLSKPPINFDGEKKTRIEWGNMTRSCKKCGFFVSSPTSSTKDIGYCLFVDPRDIEKMDSEERIKITYGNEIEIAKNCEGYVNTVDYFK